MNALVRARRLSSVSVLLLCSCLVRAQGPAPRIRGPIEASPSTPLAGSLNPHLRTAEDLGPLSPDTIISGITLVFSRSAPQEADLQQLLTQQTDPSSPLFHHWLTPDTFAARFGVADSDIVVTVAWLQSHGFTIDSETRQRITFSGTAAQIHQAFATELHHFRWSAGKDQPAELHFAPASELSLPRSLAPVTAAVLHLSDFRPKPNLRPHPNYTAALNQSHMLGPSDIATMYDLTPFGTTYNGSGQEIAVVGESYVNTANGSSINTFHQYLGGSSLITLALVPGTGVEATVPGAEGEGQIDLEYSGGVAVGSNILFVHTGSSSNYNVFDALSFAITQDVAPVISVSYGICETLLSTTDLQQLNALLEQAVAQGQTVVAASGDAGATACADYSTQDGVTTAQQQSLAVSFPASSPYVTGVGGTQMAAGTFAAGSSSYWASAGVGDTPPRCSPTYRKPPGTRTRPATACSLPAAAPVRCSLVPPGRPGLPAFPPEATASARTSLFRPPSPVPGTSSAPTTLISAAHTAAALALRAVMEPTLSAGAPVSELLSSPASSPSSTNTSTPSA